MQRIKTLSEYFKKYELSEKDPEKLIERLSLKPILKKLIKKISTLLQKTMIIFVMVQIISNQDY